MNNIFGGGLGLVACAVFKTAGRCLGRLRWVRFPHVPATTTYGVSHTPARRRKSLPGDKLGDKWVTVKTSRYSATGARWLTVE